MKYWLLLIIFILNSRCSPHVSEKAISNAHSSIYATHDKKVIVYTTAKNTLHRLAPYDTISFFSKRQPVENEVSILVDPDISFQTYFGIGGAITDAAAETFYKLPKDKQNLILTAYFDKVKGIGYNVIRTNINSCDFSSDNYTYVSENDKDLRTFDIKHDRKYKIPLIKAAVQASGNDCAIYASPWSPPAWMKDNNNMLKGGKLKPEFYPAWAEYFAKFIKAYEAEGIPMWGISVQNEPMATQRWESCIYTAEEERDFLKDHLGPKMKSEGLSDKKIIVWDHNRDLIYQRAKTYFEDKDAYKYIWGIGFHWYETWSGGDPMFNNIKLINQIFPDKNIFFTEGCKEAFKFDQIGDWSLGEKYGYNMIHDFNNGMVGFTDWNILLDETGGPNHASNFCFAPIHGNVANGEVLFTNEYYYIGHFSKFIKKGAKRIVCSYTRSQLLSTAFKNLDGSLVIIVMNQSEKETEYNLWINGNAAKTIALPRSITTLIVK